MRKHALIAIAVLSLFGCQKPQNYGGVIRKVNYKGVISLSPGATEILSMNGVQLMGRTKACNYPNTVNSIATYADLKPDYEAITKVGPDMIVVDKDLFSDAEVAKLESSKAKIFKLGARTIDEFVKELYTLGNFFGNEMNYQNYVDRINRERRVAEGGSMTPRPTGILVIPGTGGSHYICGTKAFQADVMKSIGVDLIGPDSEKFEPLSPEFVMGKNPTVIVVAGQTKDFLADTRFASLEAVKKLRIFGLDQDIVLRRGGRLEIFIQQGYKALTIVMKNK